MSKTARVRYAELNQSGLTEYHKQRLCYPFTDVPAFTFWEPPSDTALPEGACPMRAWQDGRCGLCGFRDRLVEDHDHATGMVRGMLCRQCNSAEGLRDHNLGKWRSGMTVAAALHVERRYLNPISGRCDYGHAATADTDLDLIAEAVTAAR